MKLIWTKYYVLILRLYDKKIDATGLSVFRIMYAVVLLFEVLQLFYFRNLIFDKIPFLVPSEIDFSLAFKIWMLVIVFLVFGVFTRWVALINYLFSLTFIATMGSYEYHMFYVYMLINFLLIFLDVSRVNSIDRLFVKLKHSDIKSSYIPSSKVSVLNYHIVIFLSVAFVYFDSIFFKLASKIWMKGLGMWLPASIPQITHADASLLLNSKWLMLGLGYLTVVFEAIFIFVFFRKKWRVPLMVIGIGLHVGILLEFPIPWFALGVIGTYVLMIPVGWWCFLKEKIMFKTPSITVFYDEENITHLRIKIILKHFDIFNAINFQSQTEATSHSSKISLYGIEKNNKTLVGMDLYLFAFRRMPAFVVFGLLFEIPGLYHLIKVCIQKMHMVELLRISREPIYMPNGKDSIKLYLDYTMRHFKVAIIAFFLVILSATQIFVVYKSWFVRDLRIKTGIMGNSIDKSIDKAVSTVEHNSRTLLGITHHAVFMDYHFFEYNHIIGIEAEDIQGKRYWLPIVDENGNPDIYIYGFNWCKWTFRVNGPQIDLNLLKIGVRDFTCFWARKNGFQIQSMKYHIYVKKVKIPKEWEYDFLRKQMAQPWNEIGTAYWENEEFQWDVKDIESI